MIISLLHFLLRFLLPLLLSFLFLFLFPLKFLCGFPSDLIQPILLCRFKLMSRYNFFTGIVLVPWESTVEAITEPANWTLEKVILDLLVVELILAHRGFTGTEPHLLRHG